jgi:hypothetical protein
MTMRHQSTTNSRRSTGLPAFIAVLALGAGVAACDRAPQVAPEAKQSAVPQAASPPPSVPGPAVEGANSAQTASADDQPMKSMTKDEESTAMPLPGQANDHSTLAKDSKK